MHLKQHVHGVRYHQLNRKRTMKVKTLTLMLLACLVWVLAGINILRIGLELYPAYIQPLNIAGSVVVFGLFYGGIFRKLVRKHTTRIVSYTTDRQFFLKFFDAKSFFIMAFMMTFGIALRAFHLVPDRFIAVFYTGLGTALLLAGVLFAKHYLGNKHPHLMQYCPVCNDRSASSK